MGSRERVRRRFVARGEVVAAAARLIRSSGGWYCQRPRSPGRRVEPCCQAARSGATISSGDGTLRPCRSGGGASGTKISKNPGARPLETVFEGGFERRRDDHSGRHTDPVGRGRGHAARKIWPVASRSTVGRHRERQVTVSSGGGANVQSGRPYRQLFISLARRERSCWAVSRQGRRYRSGGMQKGSARPNNAVVLRRRPGDGFSRRHESRHEEPRRGRRSSHRVASSSEQRQQRRQLGFRGAAAQRH